ncbi:MAG: beta-lactamase family protein [Chitinophagaceae bacterium]|nr:beta-lactamase family protein [Chitinophagaceae bacterium]
MKNLSHYFSLILIFCFTGLITSAQTIEEKLEAMMKEQPTVGLSVAAVKDGKIIYTHSFGYKDLERKTPLSDNDIFRIASISKSFTSVGLMQLVEKGKISLDDDVSSLAGFKIRNPKFPDKVITLRMVLSHTSSINDSQGYFDMVTINPDKNPDWAKCYNDYEPGSAYEYCNYNYNIAGTILERVSGERFDRYIAHHILEPLDIYGGFNVNDLNSLRFAMIYAYNKDSSKFILSPSAYAPRKKEIAAYEMGFTTPIFSPAGGMKISAGDLAKYMMMHMKDGKQNGNRIISKKSTELIRTPLSEKEHYGLGLLMNPDIIPGVNMYGHTGGAYGLTSLMFFDPEKKFGFVTISNGNAPFYSAGKKAIKIMYEEFIKK